MKFFITIIIVVLGAVGLFFVRDREDEVVAVSEKKENLPTGQTGVEEELPAQALVPLEYYIDQTWNNCSVAATAMALAHYDVRVSQQKLAEKIRPYNNLDGNNDDKSTVFEELVREVEDYGLTAYYRPDGDVELLKRLTAAGFPVVVRTLVDVEGDYLHFRVVKGYDETKGVIIQDDSMQGKDIEYKYDDFMAIWQQFNYQYMVIASDAKEKSTIENILGKEIDQKVAWENALNTAKEELKAKPNDARSHFNMVTALYYLGDYKKTIEEFEKVEPRLSRHVLWYQIEPIQAYFNLGNYDRVFELSDKVLNDNNKAVSELYLLKGEIYKKQGKLDLARAEFEKAVFYNKTLPEAKAAMASLGTQ